MKHVNANIGMTAAMLAVILFFCGVPRVAVAQMAVTPVTVFFDPEQRTAVMTVTNSSSAPMTLQVRPFNWEQKQEDDQLTPATALGVSPPMASIPAGSTQTVRLILHETQQTREGTYRLLLDQIPSSPDANSVHIVLRLSIPVFVHPKAKVMALMKYRLERKGDEVTLVVSNLGLLHENLRNAALSAPDGRKCKFEMKGLPYVLQGNTRRWKVVADGGALPKLGETWTLTATAVSGELKQEVTVEEPR